MKTLRYVLLIFLCSLWVTESQGQKVRTKIKVATKTHEKSKAEESTSKLFNTMLSSTAKVMFIDSVVVSKSQFLPLIPLNKESGTLSVLDKDPYLTQYENEIGDRRIIAKGDTAESRLAIQTRLGNEWGEKTIITDFDSDELKHQNFPFLCADGVTLFFSAQSEKSIGGLDIFMAIYDNDKSQWYTPQNYGLPFNSTANDYMLAIDDLDGIGWLVSDRFQPQDSVCIYTFVPTSPRKDFSNDNITTSQLSNYAKITSIKDTWKFGNRKDALSRRNAMLARTKATNVQSEVLFIINDQVVIKDAADFKSAQAKQLFMQWKDIKKEIVQYQQELDMLRIKYQQADMNKKNIYQVELLSLEEKLIKNNKTVSEIEKAIRKAELN